MGAHVLYFAEQPARLLVRAYGEHAESYLAARLSEFGSVPIMLYAKYSYLGVFKVYVEHFPEELLGSRGVVLRILIAPDVVFSEALVFTCRDINAPI